MVVKVVKPFIDVMGLPHKTGETLNVSKYGEKRYSAFIEEVKKSGKRKPASSRKAKPAIDE